MSRRVLLGSLAALGAGAVLWPYTPKSRKAVPAGRVELQYWEKWTGREQEALQRIVDRFNSTQERSWVHLVPVSDIAVKAMVAIGGGDPPDLVGLYTYNVPGYAEARAVMDLGQFARLGPATLEEYLPAVRRLLTHHGHQWAGVNTVYTLGLYYNRTLLRQSGLDPGKPPRTIGQLDEMAWRLTEIDQTRGLISRAGFLQTLPGWWPYFWPFMFGGRLLDEASGTATIDEPSCVESYVWCQRSAARYGVGASRAFAAGFVRGTHSAQDVFISGHAAMVVQGPWLANFIRAYRPDLDYACAPVPEAESVADPDHPAGMVEADVVMIPRGCPHPEESYRFLQFLQRRDVQEELALAHCKPSPFVNPTPGFMDHHTNPSIGAFDAMARSPRAQVLPRTSVSKQYTDLIGNAFDDIWSGADVTGTLRSVRTHAQGLLDVAAMRRRQRGDGA